MTKCNDKIMIPEDIKNRIVNKSFKQSGGQQTNATPYAGVELEIEGIGSVKVDYFRSKQDNYKTALEMLEYLLLETKIL